MIGLMLVCVVSYSRVVSAILILWRIGPIIRNGCGI